MMVKIQVGEMKEVMVMKVIVVVAVVKSTEWFQGRIPPSLSRRFSGASSSLLGSSGGEVERQIIAPLFLARTAALWLARAAFACLVGRGLGLSTRAPRTFDVGVAGATLDCDKAGGDAEDSVPVLVVMLCVGVAVGLGPSSASFLLSSCRLLLLARSRLLLPVC